VPAKPVNAIAADPDDNMILECAVEAGSDFIITADNHLLRLGQYEGIPIIERAVARRRRKPTTNPPAGTPRLSSTGPAAQSAREPLACSSGPNRH
jgi:hypothetical protein